MLFLPYPPFSSSGQLFWVFWLYNAQIEQHLHYLAEFACHSWPWYDFAALYWSFYLANFKHWRPQSERQTWTHYHWRRSYWQQREVHCTSSSQAWFFTNKPCSNGFCHYLSWNCLLQIYYDRWFLLQVQQLSFAAYFSCSSSSFVSVSVSFYLTLIPHEWILL